MRILIFSDLHLSDATKSLAERLLEQILSEDVDVVFHLGDLFELKDRIPNHLQKLVIDFVSRLVDQGKQFYTLFGNHDGYIRDFPSAVYLNHIKGAYLITEPKVVLDQFFFVPYDSNFQNLKSVLENSPDVPFCCIHADIEKLSPAKEALPQNLFDSFRYVFAGHIHQPQRSGKFICVGNPFARNFTETSPYNKPVLRGYLILSGNKLSFCPFDAPFYVKISAPTEDKIKVFCEAYKGKQVHLWLDYETETEAEFQFDNVEILSKIVTKTVPKESFEGVESEVKIASLEKYLDLVLKYKRDKQAYLDVAKEILSSLGVVL